MKRRRANKTVQRLGMVRYENDTFEFKFGRHIRNDVCKGSFEFPSSVLGCAIKREKRVCFVRYTVFRSFRRRLERVRLYGSPQDKNTVLVRTPALRPLSRRALCF